MFYNYVLTIPAGTTEEAPVKLEMTLAKGILQTVRLFFPPGPRGEVNVIIEGNSSQIYPSNEEGTFNADNLYINFDDYYEILQPPFRFTAKGWSPTADYEHTIRIQIGVIENRVAVVSIRLAKSFDKFFKLVGVRV